MEVNKVSPALRERLGQDATVGLLELLTETKKEWTAEVVDAAEGRFERRLAEENAKLRIEMAQGFSALRVEMAEGTAAVRREMAEGTAALRQEMAEGIAALRQEMAEGIAALRVELAQGLAAVRAEMLRGFSTSREEMAHHRFEALKWTFVFWVGQFFVFASFLVAAIRFLRPDA